MSHAKCPILGLAKDFVADCLPTVADVLRCYNYELIETMKNNSKHPSVSATCDILVSKLVPLWNRLEPNTNVISNQQIKRLLTSLHSEHLCIQKVLRGPRKRPASFEKILSEFKVKFNLIFNISACKCHGAKCICKIFHKRFNTSPAVTPLSTNTPDDVVVKLE